MGVKTFVPIIIRVKLGFDLSSNGQQVDMKGEAGHRANAKIKKIIATVKVLHTHPRWEVSNPTQSVQSTFSLTVLHPSVDKWTLCQCISLKTRFFPYGWAAETDLVFCFQNVTSNGHSANGRGLENQSVLKEQELSHFWPGFDICVVFLPAV